jgi:hypothetical protein
MRRSKLLQWTAQLDGNIPPRTEWATKRVSGEASIRDNRVRAPPGMPAVTIGTTNPTPASPPHVNESSEHDDRETHTQPQHSGPSDTGLRAGVGSSGSALQTMVEKHSKILEQWSTQE